VSLAKQMAEATFIGREILPAHRRRQHTFMLTYGRARCNGAICGPAY
jgi:hypothetical protein